MLDLEIIVEFRNYAWISKLENLWLDLNILVGFKNFICNKLSVYLRIFINYLLFIKFISRIENLWFDEKFWLDLKLLFAINYKFGLDLERKFIWDVLDWYDTLFQQWAWGTDRGRDRAESWDPSDLKILNESDWKYENINTRRHSTHTMAFTLDNHYISNDWTPKLIMKLGIHNWNKSARRSDI